MIGVERSGGVVRITLRRSDRRNALTPEMLGALCEALEGVGKEARAVVLCGEGRVFCAGFDLGVCAASPDGSAMRELLIGLDRAVRAARGCRCPVVAACHGAAIAGAAALVAAADFAVADRGAKLGYPVVRLGVSPAVSGPTLGPRVGWGAARARMLDPGLIDGVEAFRAGLVTDLVDSPEQVVPGAEALAISLAGKPSGALAATKQWLNRVDGAEGAGRAGLEASLSLTGGDEERERLRAAWGSRASG